MSNFACIGICIFVSLIMCGVFMSAYKEVFKSEYETDKSFIYSYMRDNFKLIKSYSDDINVLRARVYDLENKLKEMETQNDR